MKRKTLGRSVAIVSAALAFVVVAAGCSSSAGPAKSGAAITSAQEAAAQKLIDQATAPLTTFPGPTQADPIAKGKFVVSIPCSLAASGCQRMDAGVKAAAAAAGWRELTIDPQSDTNKTIQAIEQATRLGADAIFLGSIDPTSYQTQVDAARKAGIVVIGLSNSYPKPTTGNVNYDVSIQPELQGRMMGAWLTKEFKGKANLATFSDQENPILRGRSTGNTQYLKSCPQCYNVVQDQPFTIATINSTFPTAVKGVLASHSDVNVAWVAFDGAAAAAVPAIQQAGLQKKVKVVSFDGDKQNMQWIADGTVNVATIAVPLEWVGWAGVDQANRAFTKLDFANENIPLRLVTKENASKYTKAGFTGDFDYQSAFKKLWGVN